MGKVRPESGEGTTEKWGRFFRKVGKTSPEVREGFARSRRRYFFSRGRVVLKVEEVSPEPGELFPERKEGLT